ncbi:unnamed protein product [Arctia plantaginis]|uniref:Uncharacterized protein n=1 Tax=Arctia plantaginis TaxID=874455 RepID=A0A8S0ZS82_ARCPL|nr:unnamed protein product [Arctia plantaginis]
MLMGRVRYRSGGKKTGGRPSFINIYLIVHQTGTNSVSNVSVILRTVAKRYKTFGTLSFQCEDIFRVIRKYYIRYKNGLLLQF